MGQRTKDADLMPVVAQGRDQNADRQRGKAGEIVQVDEQQIPPCRPDLLNASRIGRCKLCIAISTRWTSDRIFVAERGSILIHE